MCHSERVSAISDCLVVDDFDPVTDAPENEGRCSVVIALMQEHRRSRRNVGVKMLQIGFVIYQVSSAFQRFSHCWVRENDS